MSENKATATRNYLVDSDDLIDELLSALKEAGWSSFKLEYQFWQLTATKTAKKVANGKDSSAHDQDYQLFAEWKEFDEEMQLSVHVSGEHDDPDLHEQCAKILTAMFAKEAFRRVNEQN